MAASPTRVYPSPLRVQKDLFLAAVHSIHAVLSRVSNTVSLYVRFACMRCQILAVLPCLPGTYDFPPAVNSQPLFKRSHKLLCTGVVDRSIVRCFFNRPVDQSRSISTLTCRSTYGKIRSISTSTIDPPTRKYGRS